MKPSACPNDILVIIKLFPVIGPCIVKICNTSLLTGVASSPFKHAVGGPMVKKIRKIHNFVSRASIIMVLMDFSSALTLFATRPMKQPSVL